jgi:hypothetical protein
MRRTMVLLVVVEEDEPRHIDTDGCDAEELSVVTFAPKRTLAKCTELLPDDVRRKAVSK